MALNPKRWGGPVTDHPFNYKDFNPQKENKEAEPSTSNNNEREEICPFCAGTGNENHWIGAGKEKPCKHCDGEGKRSPVS